MVPTKLRMTNMECECTVISGGRLDFLELVAPSSVVDSGPDSAYYFDAGPNLTFYVLRYRSVSYFSLRCRTRFDF